MLKDSLIKEIDSLSDEQLNKIADFITELKVQEQQETESKPFWQRATPQERSQDFITWTSQLAHNNISLADEAFDRKLHLRLKLMTKYLLEFCTSLIHRLDSY